jgi:hypothetical protein
MIRIKRFQIAAGDGNWEFAPDEATIQVVISNNNEITGSTLYIRFI